MSQIGPFKRPPQRPTRLFSNGRLSSWLNERKRAAGKAVNDLSDAQLLSTDNDELVKYFTERFRVGPVRLHLDEPYSPMGIEAAEVEIVDSFGEPRPMSGSRFEVHIPFDGDSQLFDLEPDAYISQHVPRLGLGHQRPLEPPPVGRIMGEASRRELVLSWTGRLPTPGRYELGGTQPESSPETVRDHLDASLHCAGEYLAKSNRECNIFNQELPSLLRDRLRTRRQPLDRDRAVESFLGIPVRRRPDATHDLVPVPRRQQLHIKPTDHAVPSRREPGISDADYEAIVEQLASCRSLIERLPRTFSPMGEDALRDVLLLILNNQFGPVSGEMFSRTGKADIVIQQNLGPVFIAECKIWAGSSAFEDAIDQLLRYLVWRDTKAAIVLFVRQHDVTSIVSKATTQCRDHPRFKRSGPPIGDVPSFILQQEGDSRREIRLAMLAVALPSQ